LRPRRLAAAALLAALAASCAPAVRLRPPEPGDYVFPHARRGELGTEDAQRLEQAWRKLLAGDVAAAEKGFRKLLARRPGLVSAETGLAYARLRAGRADEAAAAFGSVLTRQPDYAPALVGAASAAQRRGDVEAAFEHLRRAADAEPRDASVRKKLGQVKLQVTERRVESARALAAGGEGERAVEQYRRALEAAPEVSGIRLELAELLVAQGDAEQAISLLEADPADDKLALQRLGELLAEQQEYARALHVYRRLLAREPKDAEALRRSREVREALELQQMPEEYRRIGPAPRITRADLAALVAVKVTALSRLAPGEARVAVDISGSWAREHIIRVLAFEILDVYPNHTFQPGAIVRRADLARAVGRVLDLLGWPAGPAPELSDMSRTHLYHGAASRVVAAGLMDLTPAGAFEAWRPVSGQEAVDVIEGLVRLVGP
jgi:Flp pilus assembly protein TadD